MSSSRVGSSGSVGVRKFIVGLKSPSSELRKGIDNDRSNHQSGQQLNDGYEDVDSDDVENKVVNAEVHKFSTKRNSSGGYQRPIGIPQSVPF